MENNDIEKEGSAHGGFLKPHIFTLTVPQVATFCRICLGFGFLCFLNTFYLKFCLVLFSKVDGGSILSIKMNWSQKLVYRDNQFSLNIPFTFPENVTPAGKKMSKKEKIQLNVNVGTGSEVLCKTTSHPLKVRLCLKSLK